LRISDVGKLPLSAWLLFLVTAFFYIGILVFNEVASNIFQFSKGEQYDKDNATLFLAIPTILSIFTSPLFGAVVDRVGRAIYLTALACIVTMLVHIGFLAYASGWVDIHPVS
jgi:MFS family permease